MLYLTINVHDNCLVARYLFSRFLLIALWQIFPVMQDPRTKVKYEKLHTFPPVVSFCLVISTVFLQFLLSGLVNMTPGHGTAGFFDGGRGAVPFP